jgi:hypothetical protein
LRAEDHKGQDEGAYLQSKDDPPRAALLLSLEILLRSSSTVSKYAFAGSETYCDPNCATAYYCLSHLRCGRVLLLRTLCDHQALE